MKAGNESWISRASADLGELLLASEDGLAGHVLTLDKSVLELVRQVGEGAVAHVEFTKSGRSASRAADGCHQAENPPPEDVDRCGQAENPPPEAVDRWGQAENPPHVMQLTQ